MRGRRRDGGRTFANDDLLILGREAHVFELGGGQVERVAENRRRHRAECCGQAEVFWILVAKANQKFRTFHVREVLDMMQAPRVDMEHLSRCDRKGRELRVTVAYRDDCGTRHAIRELNGVRMPCG